MLQRLMAVRERRTACAGYNHNESQVASFAAISAACLHWQRAPASSIADGCRKPSPSGMVDAP
jgi:hypothetical protein